MGNDFTSLESINKIINSIVWGPLVLIFLLFVGIYFTIRFKFFQLRGIKYWFWHTIKSFFKKEGDKSSISSFQALTTSLAGAIGTGNIVGVATAITLGGPGAVFWMWVGAFLGMMTIFAENILGGLYKQKNSNGELVGGPMYYIEKGLNNKCLAIIFSLACIGSTLGMGNITQANSLTSAINEGFNVNPKFTAIILAIIVAFIIFSGVKKIVSVSEKLVPFMAFSYIVGGLIVIFANVNSIVPVFFEIFKDAFNFQSVEAGAIGFVTSKAIKYGIARGTFSNEAGLGSSPIIYASVKVDNPVKQGMLGIFQVFFDTMVGCSITAFCILCTGVYKTGEQGVVLSTIAFESVFGNLGKYFVTFSIIMFSFSTIVGWSYFGQRAFEYIFGLKYTAIYKSIYIIAILFGSVMELNFVWDLADTFNGFMMIPNLIAVMALSKKIIKEGNKNMLKM